MNAEFLLLSLFAALATAAIQKVPVPLDIRVSCLPWAKCTTINVATGRKKPTFYLEKY